jgi:hypothetical protein
VEVILPPSTGPFESVTVHGAPLPPDPFDFFFVIIIFDDVSGSAVTVSGSAAVFSSSDGFCTPPHEINRGINPIKPINAEIAVLPLTVLMERMSPPAETYRAKCSLRRFDSKALLATGTSLIDILGVDQHAEFLFYKN